MYLTLQNRFYTNIQYIYSVAADAYYYIYSIYWTGSQDGNQDEDEYQHAYNYIYSDKNNCRAKRSCA